MNSIRRMTTLLRNEYHGEGLNLADFSHDPFVQFGRWIEEAPAAGYHDREPVAPSCRKHADRESAAGSGHPVSF